MGDLMEEGEVRDMTPGLIIDLGLRFIPRGDRRRTYGLYECQYCGKEFEAISKSVKSGGIKSCGCLVGKNMTHGFSYHRFYDTWYGMLQRCTNPNHKAYKNYGGRGITVCGEWLDVANFIKWADLTHPNIEGYTLDRIDNDKGYSPENCRWADKTTQSLNQRKYKSNKSGYVGVSWNNKNNNWMAKIKSGDFFIYIGSFHAIEEAVLARDNYIIENKLPHKLSTDYKREEQVNE